MTLKYTEIECDICGRCVEWDTSMSGLSGLPEGWLAGRLELSSNGRFDDQVVAYGQFCNLCTVQPVRELLVIRAERAAREQAMAKL